MEFILFLAILALLVFLAFKIREQNIRLEILDLRARVAERFIGDPKLFWEHYNDTYWDVFSQLYSERYDQILRFGRSNDLQLPLETTEERVARKQKEGLLKSQKASS